MFDLIDTIKSYRESKKSLARIRETQKANVTSAKRDLRKARTDRIDAGIAVARRMGELEEQEKANAPLLARMEEITLALRKEETASPEWNKLFQEFEDINYKLPL